MPFSIEKKLIGLKKESVRGTAETAIDKYIAVSMDSEMEYKLNIIEDDLVRGVFEKFIPQAGTKDCTGKITLDVQSDNIGDFIYSSLGNKTSVQQGVTAAYLHTFQRDSSLIQMPSYTIFMDRSLSKKKYPLSVVKGLAFKGTSDGKVTVDMDMLFKTEATSAETFTPAFVDPTPFMFYQTQLTIGGTPNTTDYKEWSLTIDNQSVLKRIFSGSQDPSDVLTMSKILVSGSFIVYFENETERNKFLGNTSTSVTIYMQGALITGSYYNFLRFTLPKVNYTAYPFANVDGLLGANVTFNCYYSTSNTYGLLVELQNIITAY